jgi:hypothetical protein
MIEQRHIPFVLLLAVLLLYSNAWLTPFQFDDYNVIVDAAGVSNWAAWWKDLGHGLRPLLKLTYTWNNFLGGEVWGFHLFNLALHLANALLVYALVKRLMTLSGHAELAVSVAVWTALLFIAHPAHTEAVTYISGRSMSLMTSFYLAALLVYMQGHERADKRALYLYSPVLFLCAVASKETALTLPALLLLVEYLFYPECTWRERVKNLRAHLLLFLALLLLLLMQERYWRMLSFSANLHSWKVNLYTQLHAMSYLLGQTLLPWGMNIDPDIPTIYDLAAVWPDLLLWTAILFFMAWKSRRERLWLFALLWWVLQLFPLYVFLPRLDVVNDRHLYLADWPVLFLLVWLIVSASRTVAVQRIMLSVILLFCVTLTWFRNADYSSEVTLWQATVRTSPNKARPQNNLGYAYFLSGRVYEAEQAYLAALRIDKNYWRAENNLIRLRENRQ